MKLTIERAALLKTLAHVQTLVDRRNTIPILANVLLKVGDGAFILTATDMDLTIVDTVPVDAEGDGAVTVPGHTLYDIVRKLPDGKPIKIATKGDNAIKIRAGRSVFTLATLPVEEFPPLGRATEDLPFNFTMQSEALKSLIDRTGFAMSNEETRYYMVGIYLHTAPGEDLDVLVSVATDGHRLARLEMPLPEGAGNMPGIILPRKAVSELRKLVDGADQSVDIALSENQIRFTFDSMVFASKLVDGTFPDYGRVIPVNNNIVEMDRKEFSDAVERVSIIGSEKTHAVNLIFDGDTLTLLSKTNIGNDATEQVGITYNGPKLSVGFNARYILDIVQKLTGERVEFKLADETTAAVVHDTAARDALYILMPMRY